MEPYRTSGFRCPTCPESPLREFQNRLICDECHGLLIDEPDYIASCADLCNQDLELAVGDAKPTTHTCPRCERALTSAHVTLTPVNVGADVLRCDRDGLWFKDGVMTNVFAKIGRRTGSHGNRYYSGSGRVGLDGLPVSRHGPASGSLAISDWRNRPRRRAPTATPLNLYADRRLACASCATGELRFFGDRYQCERCEGTFVQNAAFEAMVMDMSKSAWDMPPATGGPGPRACPVCSVAMVVEDLEHVPIDRCAEHGIWFDPNELTVALERASREFDAHGVRAWLKRLFA